mmetsp:Transcript_16833/g.25273  ORF Transcript_16833/g.25273 Transcript_16833/m.25273 type:complete len:367 (+) Transcript_16833:97-1197(+)
MILSRSSSFQVQMVVLLIILGLGVVCVFMFNEESYVNQYLHSTSSCAHPNITIVAQNYEDHSHYTSKLDTQSQSQSQLSSYQSFNDTNPHKDSWCPYATCHNSPICTPCNRRYLFLLTTARSGSTTLLKMLNYLPNVRLSGENRNELYVASELVSNFRGPNTAHLLDQNFDRKEGAYSHNAIPPQAMSCPIQQVINTLNPPPRAVQAGVNLTGNPSLEEYDRGTILGLKTIRFQKGDWRVKDSADFLRENFPCSKVVVNIRSDVDSQLKSMNTTFSNESTTEGKDTDDIVKMNEFLIKVVEELGDEMAKLVDMNDWTQNVEVLNEVISWLGFRHCKYHAVVHENANGFGRDNETPHDIGENCHYAG